jgi:hypothetical protein
MYLNGCEGESFWFLPTLNGGMNRPVCLMAE